MTDDEIQNFDEEIKRKEKEKHIEKLNKDIK